MIEALMRNSLARQRHLAGFLVISMLMVSCPARADKIKHPVAVFAGLDKITGRTIAFEAAAGETVQFGSLQITERACYTRPATEAPQTETFVEVDEVDAANQYKRIFSGWMFAASPGLHGIEHPIYDIWLTDCKGGEAAEASPEAPAEVAPAPPESPQNPAKKTSRRQRRGQPSENRAPASGERIGERPQDQPNAEAPSLGPAIEVGPPPGFIPAPRGNRRPPVQRYYPAGPGAAPDPSSGDGY
ncbi:MAG: DUF2155 domain-containing protein [Methylocella sp.]